MKLGKRPRSRGRLGSQAQHPPASLPQRWKVRHEGTVRGGWVLFPIRVQAGKMQSSPDFKKDYVQIANDTDYKSGDRKSQRSALLTRRQLTIRGTSIPQKIPVSKYLSACTRWSEERKQTQGPSARILLSLI